jgi:hypothetical protein
MNIMKLVTTKQSKWEFGKGFKSAEFYYITKVKILLV